MYRRYRFNRYAIKTLPRITRHQLMRMSNEDIVDEYAYATGDERMKMLPSVLAVLSKRPTSPKTCEFYEHIIKTVPNAQAANIALRALSRGGKKALPSLLRLLERGRMKDKVYPATVDIARGALDLLAKKYFQSPSELQRSIIVDILSDVGGGQAVALLEDFLAKSNSKTLSQRIRIALEKLGVDESEQGIGRIGQTPYKESFRREPMYYVFTRIYSEGPPIISKNSPVPKGALALEIQNFKRDLMEKYRGRGLILDTALKNIRYILASKMPGYYVEMHEERY